MTHAHAHAHAHVPVGTLPLIQRALEVQSELSRGGGPPRSRGQRILGWLVALVAPSQLKLDFQLSRDHVGVHDGDVRRNMFATPSVVLAIGHIGQLGVEGAEFPGST